MFLNLTVDFSVFYISFSNKVLWEEHNRIYSVKVYDSAALDSPLLFLHPCRKQNGDCEGFCFPYASMQRVCGCPYGQKVDTDLRSCVTSPDEAIHPVTCPSRTFACDNGRCVSSRQRCDGTDNCLDGSDEAGCQGE